jgi:hypothetical protein
MFREDELRILHLTTTISSSIGIIGAIILLKMIHSNPHVFRNMTGRLLIAIGITNILSGIAKAIGRFGIDSGIDKTICKLQAMVLQQTMLLQAILGLCMTGYIFVIICLRMNMYWLKEYEYLVVIIALLIPVPSVIFMVFFTPDQSNSMIGDADFWCWIQTDLYSNYQIYLGYVPLIAFMFLDLCLAVGVMISISRYANESIIGRQVGFGDFVRKRTLIYLTAGFIPMFPSALNRFNFQIGKSENFDLALLQAVFSPLHGLVQLTAFMLIWKLTKRRKNQDHNRGSSFVQTPPVLSIDLANQPLFTKEQINFILKAIMFKNSNDSV